MGAPPEPPAPAPTPRAARRLPLGALVEALRPRQWPKNLLTYAGALFAFRITPLAAFQATVAFLVFCGVASGFYLVNDVLDAEADRRHPLKHRRPIASGRLPVGTALVAAVVLVVASIGGAFALTPALGFTVLGHAALQVLYNWKLKHVVLLDILGIAAGFVLRAYAGIAAVGVPLLPWFLLSTAMLALFLAVEKRKAEMRLTELVGGEKRAVLHRYSLGLLGRMEAVTTAATLTCYMLWSAGPLLNGARTPLMMLTIPFVLYGIFRYQLLSDPEEIARALERESHGGVPTERPEEILLTDPGILITVAAWAVACFLILWLAP